MKNKVVLVFCEIPNAMQAIIPLTSWMAEHSTTLLGLKKKKKKRNKEKKRASGKDFKSPE